MYNILLTDDEQIVIDSLSFIINKNFEGQVQLHTALSGSKALEIVTKEEIDIVFMDINMPGLSGLDTISCILKLKPEVVIIILSAFDRFQYAQNAMNLGAFKYITKPVNRNVVIQTIRSAMDYIDNKRGNQSAAIELHKKLDFVSPMIENDFIFSCIFNNDREEELKAYMEYFNISSNYWCIFCLEFQNINSENQHKIYLKVRDLINEIKRCLISNFSMNQIICYMPLEDYQNNLEELKKIIKQIHTKLSYDVFRGIRVGVSKIQNDILTLNDSYKEAELALSFTDTAGGICFSDDIENSNKNQNSNIEELKKTLIRKIQQGDLESVERLSELYAKELFSRETDLNKIKNYIFEVIVTARNFVVETVENYENSGFDQVFSILNNENDKKMLCDYLRKMLMDFASKIHTVMDKTENPVIVKVCDYINNHLEEELSLEQMAEIAGVSSFYLSKIFKEEKGVNYIGFVTDKRLDKAQSLLKETNLSIKEITAAVGYNDQNYFSRLFKNKFSFSPSEFRRCLSVNSEKK